MNEMLIECFNLVIYDSKLYLVILLVQSYGEVSERLKEHAWKACEGLPPSAGSNPALSARFCIILVNGSLQSIWSRQDFDYELLL